MAEVVNPPPNVYLAISHVTRVLERVLLGLELGVKRDISGHPYLERRALLSWFVLEEISELNKIWAVSHV
jgi:hypothetical protein